MTPDQRLLQSTTGTASVTFTDEDGEPAPVAGPVNVAVARGDTTVAIASTPATAAGLGVFTLPLSPAVTALLDHLTAVWVDTASGETRTTLIDIVGTRYVAPSQIRAMKNMDNEAKIPVADIRAAINWFEDTFEDYTGRSFVPRFRVDTVDGGGGRRIWLPGVPVRAVRSLTFDAGLGPVTWAAADIADLVVDTGGLTRAQRGVFSFGRRAVTVAYECGDDRPPQDVVQAAKLAIRERLLEDYEGLRDYSTITDIGIIRHSQPGPGRPFGIPAVDDVANRHRLPVCA